MKIRKKAKISVWSRLNINDIQMCGECEADIIHISVPVSYAQIYKKLNKNKAWGNEKSLCLHWSSSAI
jgi:homocitrate synthase NifV